MIESARTIVDTLEYVVEQYNQMDGFVCYEHAPELVNQIEMSLQKALRKGLLPQQEILMEDWSDMPDEGYGKSVSQAMFVRWAAKVLDFKGGGDLEDLIWIADRVSVLLRDIGPGFNAATVLTAVE